MKHDIYVKHVLQGVTDVDFSRLHILLNLIGKFGVGHELVLIWVCKVHLYTVYTTEILSEIDGLVEESIIRNA